MGSDGLGNRDRFVAAATLIQFVVDASDTSEATGLEPLAATIAYKRQMLGVTDGEPCQSAVVVLTKVDRPEAVGLDDYAYSVKEDWSELSVRSQAAREWAIFSHGSKFRNFIKNVEELFTDVQVMVAGGLGSAETRGRNSAWVGSFLNTYRQSIFMNVGNGADTNCARIARSHSAVSTLED
jgi:hypothetical protein